MKETWVRPLCQEDPPEEGMATHSSILAWIIPWTEEPGGLQSIGLQRLDMTEQLAYMVLFTFLSLYVCVCSIVSDSLQPYGL